MEHIHELILDMDGPRMVRNSDSVNTVINTDERILSKILYKQVVAIERELERNLSVGERCQLTDELAQLIHQIKTYS